jgi:hypothetical protein
MLEWYAILGINTMNQLQNLKKAVTPAKAGVQRSMKRLDSRFRGNDVPGVLQLALSIIYSLRVKGVAYEGYIESDD